MVDHTYWIAKESNPKVLCLEEINREFENDSTLIEVRKFEKRFYQVNSNSKFKILKDELCVHKSIVLLGMRIVILLSPRNRVLEIAHERHLGNVAMKNRLRRKYGGRELIDAAKCVKTCQDCQLVQKTAIARPWGVWEHVFRQSMRHTIHGSLQPLLMKEYLLVLIDHYSKYYKVETTYKISVEVI